MTWCGRSCCLSFDVPLERRAVLSALPSGHSDSVITAQNSLIKRRPSHHHRGRFEPRRMPSHSRRPDYEYFEVLPLSELPERSAVVTQRRQDNDGDTYQTLLCTDEVVVTTTQWITPRHRPAAYAPISQQLQGLQLRSLSYQQ